MRPVFAVIAALIGGYLLWMAFRLGRVLLVLDAQVHEPGMLAIAGGLAAVGLGLLALAWWLFRPRRKPPGGPAA